MKPSVICIPGREGFRGLFYASGDPAGRVMIVLAGEKANSPLNRAFAGWFLRHQHCSVLSLALQQDPSENPGLNLWNLNVIGAAVRWLKNRDLRRIGICGISMQAVIALSAAARIPELSLVLAFSPCDYVPWGFRKGPVGRHKSGEYPTKKSLLTFKGQPLPFQEANQEKEAYYETFLQDSRKHHEPRSRGLFDLSEELHPIAPEVFIPAEQIRGAVVLIGAEDDSMWNSTRYIHRLHRRLREKEFMFPIRCFVYSCGTHLLLPQRMLTDALPLIGGLVPWIYRSGRRHPFKCRASRLSLERKLTEYLSQW